MNESVKLFAAMIQYDYAKGASALRTWLAGYLQDYDYPWAQLSCAHNPGYMHHEGGCKSGNIHAGAAVGEVSWTTNHEMKFTA